MRPFLIACLLTVLPLSASAQPLADKLPGDALIYVGWRGMDDLGPGYANSHLKAMMDQTHAAEMMQKLIPQIVAKVIATKHPPKDAQDAMQAAAVIIPDMFRHPTAIYFGGVTFAGNGPPNPKFAIVCDAGDDAKNLLDSANKLLAMAGPAPIPVKAELHGNILLFEIGNSGVGAYLDANPPATNLASADGFKSTVGKLNADPVIAMYVDGEGMMTLVSDVLANAPPDARAMWPGIRDGIGLKNLKRIAVTAGFDNGDWSTQAMIVAPAPRSGLLGHLLDPPALSDGLFKAIPKSSTMMFAASFDIAKYFDDIRDLVAKIDPRAQKEFDDAIAQVNKMLGFDLHDDLLAALGNEWAIYNAPDIGGRGGLGIVFVNELKDPAKFANASGKLKDLVNTQLAQQIPAPFVLAFRDFKLDAGDLHYLAAPLIAPTWGVKGNTLVAALYPEVVSDALDATGGPSILDNETFKAAMTRLGNQKPIGVSFIDLPKTAPDAYPMILAVSRLFTGIANVCGIDTPAFATPSLKKVMPHLSPAVSVSWVDDVGVHGKSVTPFPGAEVYEGGERMVIGAAMLGISVALPAFSQARERAEHVRSISNLHQIGTMCRAYETDFNKFPPDLGDLALKTDLAPQTFISPSSHIEVPADFQNRSKDEQAKWINDHSDYVYITGLNGNSPAEKVLAYEKPSPNHQGGAVLYVDAHVEWKSQSDLEQIVEQNKPTGP